MIVLEKQSQNNFLILSDISGTAAMTVGRNSEASPLLPFLMREDLSEIVSVDPYPTLIPFSKTQFSAANSRICANGK